MSDVLSSFTLYEAVKMLHLPYPSDKASVEVLCPNCSQNHSSRRKTLRVDYSKNCYACPRCGIGGGVFDFWAFHQNLGEGKEARSNAAAQIKEALNGVEFKSNPIPPKEFKEIDQDVAPLSIRHQTYTALLNSLILTDDHRNELKGPKRGLSDATIDEQVYRSYPQVNLDDIANDLLMSGYVLDGVGGFFKREDGRWTLKRMPRGIIIPSRTGKGEIQSLQIRKDEVKDKDDKRYLTLSTAGALKGAKGPASCHFARGNGCIDTIVLTEGPLKGQIIAEYTKFPTIGTMGVNCTADIPDILSNLKTYGLVQVLIAFDMDLYENEYVQKALAKLIQMIEAQGIYHSRLDWDVTLKGLDDWLLSNKSNLFV